MNTFDIRVGSKPFSDAKRFPYGFKKSGDFSIEESTILTMYGATLSGLQHGLLAPNSTEESHFVEVMINKALPINKIEKTWMKYVRLSMCPKRFYTLHSSNKGSDNESANDDYDYDDSEDAMLAIS